jgi:hypothetical protein
VAAGAAAGQPMGCGCVPIRRRCRPCWSIPLHPRLPRWAKTEALTGWAQLTSLLPVFAMLVCIAGWATFRCLTGAFPDGAATAVCSRWMCERFRRRQATCRPRNVGLLGFDLVVVMTGLLPVYRSIFIH